MEAKYDTVSWSRTSVDESLHYYKLSLFIAMYPVY